MSPTDYTTSSGVTRRVATVAEAGLTWAEMIRRDRGVVFLEATYLISEEMASRLLIQDEQDADRPWLIGRRIAFGERVRQLLEEYMNL